MSFLFGFWLSSLYPLWLVLKQLDAPKNRRELYWKSKTPQMLPTLRAGTEGIVVKLSFVKVLLDELSQYIWKGTTTLHQEVHGIQCNFVHLI